MLTASRPAPPERTPRDVLHGPISSAPATPLIRLELAGPHTRIHAVLCLACPHGPAGCCAAPPAVAWADIGRIASLGGAAWLLHEIAEGRLRPSPRGLAILRVPPADVEGRPFPGRCVYLGPRGCTIAPERRSATCNYYVCDEALAPEGAPAATVRAAHAAHETLMDLYAHGDLTIADEVTATWPDGPPWDEPFLAWLATRYERLLHRKRRLLRPLQPSR